LTQWQVISEKISFQTVDLTGTDNRTHENQEKNTQPLEKPSLEVAPTIVTYSF